MSLPGWLQDPSAVQNSAFISPEISSVTGMHSYDSAAGVIPPSAIDPHQFQQQAHQRAQLQNGTSRTSSPGFPQPAYNVNAVVPLKRPRPREESITLSPRQTSGNLPTSRSHTPMAQNQQLAYQIYQSNHQNAQQRQYTPVGYTHPHLQHVGSATTSPSPVMQNQTFNQQNVPGGQAPPPKRVATQSPSPFSPAPSQQSFMAQSSPPPPNHVSRVNTPQNNISLALPPQQSYPQGFSQGFSPPPSTASSSPAPVSAQHMQQQMQNPMQAQMLYQMQARQQQQRMIQQQQQQHQQHQQQQQLQHQQQLQQQAQRMGTSAAVNTNIMVPNSMNPSQVSHPPGQGQVVPGPGQRQTDPNQFMKMLYEFMQKQGTPITGYPQIGGRSVSLVSLYGSVLKMGGSRKVTSENKWMLVAMGLGYNPDQHPSAAEEMMNIYKQNLGSYEMAWLKNQQRAQMARQNPQQMPGMGPQQQPPQQPPQPQQPKPMANTQISQQQMQQRPQGVPKQPTPVPNNQARPNMQNGYTPQPATPARQQSQYGQSSSTPVRIPMDVTSPHGPVPSPSFSIPPTPLPQKTGSMIEPVAFAAPQPPVTPVKEIPSDFKPKVRGLDTHGGFPAAVLGQIGAEIMFHKPTIPMFQELGVIDIHALTMMLKSGLAAEVRHALDTLATVSVESRWSIALESCEDLIETLVDVAESQVELLGEHSEESSESIAVPAYEDVMRACKAETERLVDIPRFGTIEHELEKAADKLICITTIFRNLSFFESNHKALADPNVVRFLSAVIERLGTSKLLLRTYTNTLDFMKDIIIYLSNLSHSITLPSEDEALNLLHLILAFAPQPLPTVVGRESLMFTSYSPSIHRYLPPAVDSLAKLLARDEPNRAFYRTIFLSESSTTPPYDLLTRSFALAISPIPDNTKVTLPQVVEARKPFLEQGMLAAEILAGIAPGPDQGVARSWLSSEDGFALSLLRLVCLLSPQVGPMHARQGGKMPNPDDSQPFARITHRGMAVLQRLAEKSELGTDEASRVPLGVLPKKESLLGALLTVQIDGAIVKQLCTYAGLND